jgi:hypothetical protein
VSISGRVVDRSTDSPLKGALVQLPPLKVSVVTDDSGVFDLPPLKVGVYEMVVSRFGFQSVEGDLTVEREGSVVIPLSPLLASPVGDMGQMLGRVTDHRSGQPIPNAAVSLPDRGRTRITDRRGRFEFDSVLPGFHSLRVENLGYATRDDSVFVGEGQILDVGLELDVQPIDVEGFTARVQPRWLASTGFFRRKGRGYDGRQWDRTQLDALEPEILRDVLETVSGVNQAGLRGYLIRGRCKMTVFVEGLEMPGWYDLDMIRPERVEALEVFHGRGSTMPIEYAGYCGVALIWLRH